MEEKEISRLSRITSILTLLKSKRILTATAISKKFNISVRTVYRDIRALEASGIPIITIEGKGYSLMDGYTIPPLMFSEAEANSLITAEHLINNIKDESIIRNFQEALTKVKAIFRYGIKEKSEHLSAKILVFKNANSHQTSNSLSEIQSAITGFSLIKIKYKKLASDEITTRTIEPLAIYCANENWILIAWCSLRKNYRAFRIDRIMQADFLNSTFKDRNFDIREYFASCSKTNF